MIVQFITGLPAYAQEHAQSILVFLGMWITMMTVCVIGYRRDTRKLGHYSCPLRRKV